VVVVVAVAEPPREQLAPEAEAAVPLWAEAAPQREVEPAIR